MLLHKRHWRMAGDPIQKTTRHLTVVSFISFFSRTAFAAALLILTFGVLAHTNLVETKPAADARLESSPEQLELTFGGKLRLMNVELINEKNQPVGISFVPSTEPDLHFRVALPTLPAGTYTTRWVGMGLDGHKMSGSYTFSVEGASAETTGAGREHEPHHH